jgi:para-nitrobenzyl esterase
MSKKVLLVVVLSLFISGGPAFCQTPRSSDLLKRFDKNGDGKIDDEERRSVRAKMKEMQNKPGAMTPSGKTETIGNREVTEMEYASSDGRKIPCVLSMPQGDGPFPVLVTIHGGQGNRDFGYLRTMAAPNPLSPTITAFNEQPWAIVAISYRSGNGALFGMEHDDVIAGIRFAKSLPKIDPALVGVVGGSHGGHLALVAAEKMGNEFLCVAVGSPWMTDPVVYMTGDPAEPPLSLVRQQAREDLVKNGQSLFRGLTRGRGLSEQEALDFLRQNSIEANSDKIVIPTLFITSRGDDQAPHVLIEPMIDRMKSSEKDVSVYTAEKSPHGFYWARTVSAARSLRGEKSTEEEQEEKTARETMIAFFSKQFAKMDVRAVESSPGDNSASKKATDSSATQKREAIDGRGAKLERVRQQHGGNPSRAGAEDATIPRTRNAANTGRGPGFGGTSFEAIAGDSETITRERFKQQMASSPALASRPEIADRIFDKLDSDGNGSLSKKEFEEVSNLRNQFSGGGANESPGMKQEGGRAKPEAPAASPPRRSIEKKSSTTTESESLTNASGKSTSVIKTSPIRIASGQLVGEQRGDIRVFRGIPYASPPIGDLRWQAPQPAIPWSGIHEGTAFGSPALQGETFFSRTQQSEDCLFLNVWAPAKAGSATKAPVLFWIHGGAFIQGSGAQPRYDGTELAKRGIVVITINYRLGPMGLFAHPALTAESAQDSPLGNLCLLDMMAALRWTRENIAAFGGDADNITISGSSAGGTSCLFLMGIPEADGLFHKAIIHSSGGIRNIQTLAQAEAAGLRLTERLGLDRNVKSADLRGLRSDDFAISTALFRELDLPVKPIVDGRLVTQVPADTFAAGKQARIPVLMGAANGESGARQFGDDIATGGAFGFQVENAILMARVGQPVYLFQLTYVPPAARASRHASLHGESVAYAFGTFGQSTASQYGFRNQQVASRARNPRRGGGAVAFTGAGREDDTLAVEDSSEGRRISEAMMDYWAAFMRTGCPDVEGKPVWSAFSDSDPEAMVFGNDGIQSRGFNIR